MQQDVVKQPLTLTVSEAAGELRKTERAMRQLIWRGVFPVRRIGKSIIILRSDLERFLQELPSD